MTRPVLLDMMLPNEAATTELARSIGAQLRPGDTLLLDGDIGAGKTHFARSLIQSLQDIPEDVPSPTFTLVQVYDTRAGEIWHADLYRLTGPDEIIELGLQDALGALICVVEWPDRLGEDSPEDALTLSFRPGSDPDVRHIVATGSAPHWHDRLSRFAYV